MTTKQYQNLINPLLKEKLAGFDVQNEWVAFRGLHNHYSPRVDIAVGPFSITPGLDRVEEYNQLLQDDIVNDFMTKLYQFHLENVEDEVFNEIVIPPYDTLISKNLNARCFMAIEIENKNSKKHIMGSVVNAASLGRVGIGVAYSDNTLRTFVRIMNYLGFLKRVEKNTYDTTNFLLVTKEQFDSVIHV